MTLEAEAMQRIMVQVDLGVDVDDSPFPVNAEERRFWEQMVAEFAEAKAKGWQFEPPEIEMPEPEP